MCESAGLGAAPDEALGALVAAGERLSAAPLPDGTPMDLGEDLVTLRRAIERLELRFARMAGAFTATTEWDDAGFDTPLMWLRHVCHMGGRAAADAVFVGENLASMPQTAAALETGAIGFQHAALLARTALDVAHSPTGGSFDERPLLLQALKHTVSRFRRDCEHARHAADARAVLDETIDLVEHRRLELVTCGGGGVILRGILDPLGGAALRAALEPLAARTGPDDRRDRERRFGDALVELSGHSLDCDAAAPGRGRRPHLQVTATLETLLGCAGAPGGDLDLAPPLPTAAVQRLACDASVRRILLGPDSAVLDVGRARRVPSGATRAALAVRQGGCVWPGCERPASWTQAHHLVHWVRGGLTEIDNLVLLCHPHHWRVHEGGWHIVRTADAGIVVVPPAPVGLPAARAPALPPAA